MSASVDLKNLPGIREAMVPLIAGREALAMVLTQAGAEPKLRDMVIMSIFLKLGIANCFNQGTGDKGIPIEEVTTMAVDYYETMERERAARDALPIRAH